MSKRIRLTEDFIRTFEAVKDRLGGSYKPETLVAELNRDANFVTLVGHLDMLSRAISDNYNQCMSGCDGMSGCESQCQTNYNGCMSQGQ